ncbi:MAG: SDR family oxidoreductase [Myxococcales bacterium]|nr:SDR family oxidoreductase [Myxococcales bacterium]
MPTTRRSKDGGKRDRIVVTGIAGRLGRLVARRLHRLGDCTVVGIDRRAFPGRPRDVVHVQVDLRSKKARDVFRAGDVRALIHLGVMHDPRRSGADHHSWNVQGTQRLLDACATYGVPKVIVLSSANVYGPRPDNPQFLGEDAPLMASQDFPAIRDLIEVDMLASSFFWKSQEIETVILRPVHILGTVHNAPSNYLRLPVVPTLLGFDPMIQAIHEEDVVEALIASLRPGVRGIFNLTGPGEVPLSTILRELGKRTLPIPHPFAKSLLTLLWRGRFTSFPAPELHHIRFVCMVDGSRANRDLGFKPRFSLKETIRAVEGRLSDRQPPATIRS